MNMSEDSVPRYLCVSIESILSSATPKTDPLPTVDMDDTSLDDFLADEGSEDGDDATDLEDGAADPEDDATEPGGSETEPDDSVNTGSVDPATTTSQWAGDGVTCADCGGSVERVWESEAGLVCATCKEW
jgi:hypothetical protein